MVKIYEHIVGKTNSDFVYQILKKNILKLDLKPGEEIREQELLNVFDMSRTPIREALILLKHDGLIKALPQSGTFVTKIDKDKFESGRMLRICVETGMIKLACEKFNEEDLEKLRENIEKQKYILATSKDFIEFHKLDLEFHQLICKGVGYLELLNITSNNFFDYLRVRELNSSNKIKDNYILKGHEKIYEIIKSKNVDSIDEVLKNHFRRLKEKLPELIEEYPYFFKKK